MTTRRTFLAGVASLPAIAAAEALPANLEPTDAASLIEELSWALASALDDYQGGRFHAEVHPASQHQYAASLVKTSARRQADAELLAIKRAAVKLVAAIHARDAAYKAQRRGRKPGHMSPSEAAYIQACNHLHRAELRLAEAVQGEPVIASF